MDVLTAPVETLNVAVVEPAETVTLEGTAATPGLPLERETAAPVRGAPVVNVTTPREAVPPVTLAGLTATLCRLAGGGLAVGDVTVNVAVLVVPL